MKKQFILTIIFILCFSSVSLAHNNEVEHTKNDTSTQKVHSGNSNKSKDTVLPKGTSNVEYSNNKHSYMIPYVIVIDVIVLFIAFTVIYLERKKHTDLIV